MMSLTKPASVLRRWQLLLPALMLCLLLPVAFAAEKKQGKKKASAEKVASTPGERPPGVPVPKLVSFPAEGETLNGYLYVPEGKGPFRAMIFNFGSHSRLLDQSDLHAYDPLAKVYLSDNYVLFVPDRRVGSAGSEREGAGKNNAAGKAEEFLQRSEMLAKDVLAATRWLKQQSFVDRDKIFISGVMTGAQQALLAAEKDSDLRAVVVFSPGGVSWNNKPELQMLLRRTVKNVKVPAFLIQVQNDASLGPIEALGPELLRKPGMNKTMIYPAYGKGADDARKFAIAGWDVWGYDVLTFLDKVVESKRR